MYYNNDTANVNFFHILILLLLSKINIVMKQTVSLSAQEWQAFALEIHILLLLHFQIVNVDLLFVGDNLNAEWLFSQVIYQQ